MSDLPRPAAQGAGGAAATGHPLATGAALEAFAAGGGAVDAAVAAAYALCVVLPESCGLGGDALFLVREPAGTVRAYNGTGSAPAGFRGTVPGDGAGTATVPGLVAALHAAHAQHGAVPMPALLAPAVRLAADGFPAGAPLVDAAGRQRHRLARRAGDWEVPFATIEPGQLVRQLALAETIEQIGREGPRAFYSGPLAAAIAAACRADGAAMAEADLAAHATVESEPVSIGFHGATVHAQPPVTQAILALMALRRLEPIRDADRAVRSHAAVEALQAAFQHRDRISAPGAAEALLAIDLDIDLERARRLGGPTVQSHTTAIATADARGTVVSMVISVFDEFGSSALVPEGGFFLNNRMQSFSADPASPNAPGPGKRPVHTLCPMLVEGPSGVLALSTPGADGQVQTLVQIIDALLVEGVGLTAALDRRRWRATDQRLVVEDGLDAEVADGLAARGHDLDWRPAGDRAFGAAVAAGIDARHGGVLAAADLRREAWAGAR